MKRILFILMALLSFNAFTEPLTGIFDVKFGDNQKTVIEKMNKKGWISESNDTTDLVFGFEKTKGTYGNLPVKYIFIFFSDDNRLNQIDITFDNIDRYDFKKINDTLITKYKIEDKDVFDTDDMYSLEGRTENNIKVSSSGLHESKIYTINFEDCNSDL